MADSFRDALLPRELLARLLLLVHHAESVGVGRPGGRGAMPSRTLNSAPMHSALVGRRHRLPVA